MTKDLLKETIFFERFEYFLKHEKYTMTKLINKHMYKRLNDLPCEDIVILVQNE